MVVGLASGLAVNTAYADSDEPSKPQAHSDGLIATIDDAAITAKVKTALSSERHLKTSNISVTTTNGVVTLEGSAANSKAKKLAGSVAVAIDGVKSVDNSLKTPNSSKTVAKTKEAVSDSWITTKVKSDLIADSVAKGFDINVVTTDGVVVLKGTLANQDAIDHVKDLAGKVKGVKGVDVSALICPTK